MVFGYHDQIANLPNSWPREAPAQDALQVRWTAWPPSWAPGTTGQPQLARELAESYSRIAALRNGFAPSAYREPAGLLRQPRQGPGPGASTRQHRLRRAPLARHLARGRRDARGLPSWPCAAASSPRDKAAGRRRHGSTERPAPRPQDNRTQAQLASVLGRLGLLVGNRNPLQAQLGDLNAAGRIPFQSQHALVRSSAARIHADLGNRWKARACWTKRSPAWRPRSRSTRQPNRATMTMLLPPAPARSWQAEPTPANARRCIPHARQLPPAER